MPVGVPGPLGYTGYFVLVSPGECPEYSRSMGPLALVLIILVLLLGIMLILVIAGLRVGLCSVGQ